MKPADGPAERLDESGQRSITGGLARPAATGPVLYLRRIERSRNETESRGGGDRADTRLRGFEFVRNARGSCPLGAGSSQSRQRAFERSVLGLVTPAGTGWSDLAPRKRIPC